MAREVHDAVAQGLVSVLLQLRAAQRCRSRTGRTDDAIDALADARSAAEAVFEETRRSVLGLAPSPLEGRSLEEALELELAWANRTGVVEARLVTAGTPVVVPTRRRAHVVPHRPGGADERDPSRAGRRPSGSGRLRRHRRHLARAGRRRRLRPVPARGVTASGTVSVWAAWPSGRGCWAARWSSSRRPVGVPGSARGSRRPPMLRTSLDGPGRSRAGARGRRSRGDPGRHRSCSCRRPIRALQVVGEAASGDRGGHRVASAAARRGAHGPADARRRRHRRDRPDPGGGRDGQRRRRDGVRQRRAGGRRVPSGSPRVHRQGGVRGRAGQGRAGRGSRGRWWCRVRRSSGSTRISTARLARSRFTDREREVLSFLERGSTDREIAAALTISVKTVEKHVGAILRKLGAQNRTQAVARARERVAG